MDNGYNNQENNQDYIQQEIVKQQDEKSSVRKSSKRFGFFALISVVLIVAMISSVSTGFIINSHFNSLLDNRLSALTASNPASTNTNNANYSSGTIGTSNAGINPVTRLALAKDSSITQIAKAVGPSVIGIRMTVAGSNNWAFSGQGSDVYEGSGIILNKNGYIMTNYHVVDSADPKNNNNANTTLEVFLPDKRQLKAKFIGGDQTTDLAVIKIDAANLQPAELGDSSKLQVGELAVAIGNPLGMEFAGSVTSGIVSALNRMIDSENSSIKVIQTDAAINPGNSGGALVNSQGQIIGINSSKISETGIEGLGFAIPINDAKPIIDQLMMFGYVKGRPFLGVAGQDISNILSQVYRIPAGIYVTDVTPGSGAYNAGIQNGDIIISMGGKKVNTLNLDSTIKQYKVGSKVVLQVYRDGQTMNVNVTLTEEH